MASSRQNIYSDFHYLDRKGNLFTAKECREPADLETTPTHHESKSYTTNSTGFWGNLLVIGVLIVVGYFVLGAVIKVIETIGVIFAIIF